MFDKIETDQSAFIAELDKSIERLCTRRAWLDAPDTKEAPFELDEEDNEEVEAKSYKKAQAKSAKRTEPVDDDESEDESTTRRAKGNGEDDDDFYDSADDDVEEEDEPLPPKRVERVRPKATVRR